MFKNPRPKKKIKKPLPPKKPKNLEQRKCEYLTEDEIYKLQKVAAQHGRHPIRDEALILLMFRHALRVGELISLRWDQIDLKKGFLHVRKIKHGLPSTHPVKGPELRILRKLEREYPNGSYVFISENQSPLTARTVHHIIARAGKLAQFLLLFTPTCYVTVQAFTLPIKAKTHALFKVIWDIPILKILLFILSYHLHGLEIFGKISREK